MLDSIQRLRHGYQKVARIARVATLVCVVASCATIFAVWIAKRVPWGGRPVTGSWWCLVYLHGVAICMAFALVSRGLLVMLERHVRSVDSGLAALSRKESARMTKKSLKSVILPCVLGVLFLGFLIVAIVVDSVRDLSLTTQKVLAGVECSLLFFSLLLVVYQSFYAARAKKTVPTASPSDSPSDTVPLLTGDIRPSVGGSVMDVGLAIASRILDGASLSYCGRRLVDESSRSTLATNQFSFEGSDPFTPGANVIADLGINRVDNPEFEGVEVVLKVAHGDLEGMRRWAGDRPSSSLVEAEGPEQQALEGGCDESFMEVSDDVSLLSSL